MYHLTQEVNSNKRNEFVRAEGIAASWCMKWNTGMAGGRMFQTFQGPATLLSALCETLVMTHYAPKVKYLCKVNYLCNVEKVALNWDEK